MRHSESKLREKKLGLAFELEPKLSYQDNEFTIRDSVITTPAKTEVLKSDLSLRYIADRTDLQSKLSHFVHRTWLARLLGAGRRALSKVAPWRPIPQSPGSC